MSTAASTTAPRTWPTVAIVGVGLMGASLGLALKRFKRARKIIGIGRRPQSLEEALRIGAIDEGADDLASGVHAADVIVLCTPVDHIADGVQAVARHCPAHALITDAGSTKSSIVEAVARQPQRARFVGSHPLAGSEKTGAAHGRADLYVGRTVIVTPTAATPAADVQETLDLWAAVGAKTTVMSPDEHDRAVAAISHLPHLVAAALVGATAPGDVPLAASGFKDTTRIAAGDVTLWQQILLDNRGHVLKSLTAFEKTLSHWRAALEAADEARLRTLLAEAKAKRDAVGS